MSLSLVSVRPNYGLLSGLRHLGDPSAPLVVRFGKNRDFVGGNCSMESSRKVIVKAVQRDADAAVMASMRRKLRFRRNPRCDPDSRWHEQVGPSPGGFLLGLVFGSLCAVPFLISILWSAYRPFQRPCLLIADNSLLFRVGNALLEDHVLTDFSNF